MNGKQLNIPAEQNDLLQSESASPQTPSTGKKPYEKPGVMYRAPLEAMAATCSTFPGKAAGVCGTAFS